MLPQTGRHDPGCFCAETWGDLEAEMYTLRPGAAFASDRHGGDQDMPQPKRSKVPGTGEVPACAVQDLPKACDVLSLTTEVVPEEDC